MSEGAPAGPVDREWVARRLEEIARLLELRGDDFFKTRAYSNAARIVRGLDGDLTELVRRGELRRVRGIGPALTEKITALVTTGGLPYLDRLREQVPPGLLQWLGIRGLGVKKVRLIHTSLGISTLDELEAACRAGRLRDLAGIGEATERKILERLEGARERAARFPRPLALAEAERLLERVRAAAGVLRAEAAGSVRRAAEVSKDVDLVAAAADPAPAMDALAGSLGVEEITERGPTRASVRLDSGLAADLRVVNDEAYPFALLYFTGSKAHNVALRARAQRRGLRLNEYGLVREQDGQPIPCADEAGIYRALGLVQWIPPELREDQGELEASERGELPRLLEPGDLVGVLHLHTRWSDGRASVEEMAEAALARGLAYVGVTDHSRSASYAGGMSADHVRLQQAEIDTLNARLAGRCTVLKGIEVDILPDGALDYPDELLATFDLVIAAVHTALDLPEPEQTRRLLRALDHPRVDMLAHPTGRKLLRRGPVRMELHRVLETAADRGIAIEVNAHPDRLDPEPTLLRYAVRRGAKTSINPDAHRPEELAAVRWGVEIARRAWCTSDDVLNAWPLPRLLDHLRQRRREAGIHR